MQQHRQDYWTEIYKEKSPDSVSWYQAAPEPSLHALDRLGASASSSLIDIGGGASNLVDALLDSDWNDLTVLDIAAPALEAAKQRLGACYHSELYRFEHQGYELGIVGCAVGASYAVLIAEQMFASGCEMLVSITSSGQITPLGPPPYFILIEKALRDEGTSYHYLPPADYAEADEQLVEALWPHITQLGERVTRGATWTTDAPFRETTAAIEAARSEGLLAVEMEASALYAFARSRKRHVICFAHVTNQMGRTEGDFEKGEENGATAAVELIGAIGQAWRNR